MYLKAITQDECYINLAILSLSHTYMIYPHHDL